MTKDLGSPIKNAIREVEEEIWASGRNIDDHEVLIALEKILEKRGITSMAEIFEEIEHAKKIKQ